jgi:hypothetical protein
MWSKPLPGGHMDFMETKTGIETVRHRGDITRDDLGMVLCTFVPGRKVISGFDSDRDSCIKAFCEYQIWLLRNLPSGQPGC